MGLKSKYQILIAGRLSGPKNDVILNILQKTGPLVVQKIPHIQFQVVGAPVLDTHLNLAKKYSWIQFLGFQRDITPYYQKADLIIGSGRVILEALKLKKPVIAIGECRYIGPLLEKSILTAQQTNFGDCDDKEYFDWDLMAEDIIRCLKKFKLRTNIISNGYKLLKSEYNSQNVEEKIEHLYNQTIFENNLKKIKELPVLMYHQVFATQPEFSKFHLNITVSKLEEQLKILKFLKKETITFSDLFSKNVSPRSVILTFDDGYENHYRYLLPLLEKYQMKAVVYILGNFNIRKNFWDIPKGECEYKLLKKNQILKMSKSEFVEFGAHSMTHCSLPDQSFQKIKTEISNSKNHIENLVQKSIYSFAYPYGNLNEKIKNYVKKSGFYFGVAVDSGPFKFTQDLFEIRRIHVFPNTSAFQFIKKVSGYYLRYRMYRQKFHPSTYLRIGK
jgi:peptidoglycan/xylan/chitin deacetylase (PgdA/CDA1 family)